MCHFALFVVKRWFAHYHMTEIRYWNTDVKLSLQHAESLDMEPEFILRFEDLNQNDDANKNEDEEIVNRKRQVLKAHNFAYDELLNKKQIWIIAKFIETTNCKGFVDNLECHYHIVSLH